jgi:hypothetical protein
VPVAGGMRHTSMALYFCGASEKTLHKPRVTFRNMLFKISYSLDNYLQLYVNSFSLNLPKFLKILFWHQNSAFPKIFIISVYDC